MHLSDSPRASKEECKILDSFCAEEVGEDRRWWLKALGRMTVTKAVAMRSANARQPHAEEEARPPAGGVPAWTAALRAGDPPSASYCRMPGKACHSPLGKQTLT